MTDLSQVALGAAIAPPDAEKTATMIVAIRELSCLVVSVNHSAGLDVLKMDDVPKKRLQSLLRSQMCIEYLIKLVQLCWEGFFGKQVSHGLVAVV